MAKSKSPKSTAIDILDNSYLSASLQGKLVKHAIACDGFEDDPDAYEADNIFFVPPEARWSEIAKSAHTPEIGTILDKAMITTWT